MNRLRSAGVWTAVEEEEEGEGKKEGDKGVHVGRDKSVCQTLRSLLTEISVAANARRRRFSAYGTSTTSPFAMALLQQMYNAHEWVFLQLRIFLSFY